MPAPSAAAPADLAETWSLACHACGRCCNSPPALSLRELFRHGDRFIGCIAVTKVAGLRAGERLASDGRVRVLDAADVAAFDTLAAALYSRVSAGRDWLSVSLQGFGYASLERCPALADDGRCAIHEAGKPAICDAVPLDPFAPDRWQAWVVGARRDTSVWAEAGCLQRGPASNAFTLIDSGRVATPALDACRDALQRERTVWRDAVAGSLMASGPAWARSWAQLTPGARLTLPIVPALLEVARHSPRCRDACVDLVDRQGVLIGTTIDAALARRHAADRATTQELRRFADVLTRARGALTGLAFDARGRESQAEVEAWLGLD
ncbi:MAG: flagellin N-methylase [Burkholderia gladioli]